MWTLLQLHWDMLNSNCVIQHGDYKVTSYDVIIHPTTVSRLLDRRHSISTIYRQVYIPYSALLWGPNSHTVPPGGQKSHTVPQGGQVSCRNKQTCFCNSRVPSDAYCHSNMHRLVPSSYVTAWSRKYLLTGAVGLYWFNKRSALGAMHPRASRL